MPSRILQGWEIRGSLLHAFRNRFALGVERVKSFPAGNREAPILAVAEMKGEAAVDKILHQRRHDVGAVRIIGARDRFHDFEFVERWRIDFRGLAAANLNSSRFYWRGKVRMRRRLRAD